MDLHRFRPLAVLFGFLVVSLSFRAPEKGTLVLTVTDLESDRGTIRIAVFDREENFLRDSGWVLEKVAPLREGEKKIVVRFSGLAYGRYALAVFHDLNENKILDTNLLGIPTEPYAFSNNPRVKWQSPKFAEACFEFRSDGQEVVLVMKRWKNQ